MTLDLEKKEVDINHDSDQDSGHDQNSEQDSSRDQNSDEFIQNEDDTDDLIDNSGFYGGQRATYASLLTQGHLYFRSWNELQAQVCLD